MRRFVVLSLLCGVIFLVPRMTFSEGSAAAPIDLADLDLKLVEARAVDTIAMSPTALKPGKGEKLVVVSLRGKLPAPGRLTVAAAAFTTLYSEPVVKPGESNAERVGRSQAQAIDLGQEETWAASATTTYPKARDVRLDVALPLPAGVNDFFLLYDTAKGKQRLGIKMGAKGTTPSP